MPKTASNPPKYRHFKPKNLAVVRIDGRDIYLGKHGSPESWERYARVIAEWRAGHIAPPSARPPGRTGIDQAESPGPSINELILAYLRHAEVYYRHSDGSPTGEQDQIRLALRPLRSLYGSTPARDFSPNGLKLVRQAMIDSGLCRRTINQRIGRILRAFRFAVENELVPPSVLQGLKAISGLKEGRSSARPSKKVQPVPEALVDATRPFLSRQLQAVVDLQRLTGMRSSEALMMRTCDLDMTGHLWEYVPQRHKTEHHGKERRIFLGPRAQEVIRPWLRLNLGEYLFQPKEAREEFDQNRRRNRKTPMTPSQRARKKKAKPRKSPGDRYDARAYQHAVAKACQRAFVHPTLSKISVGDLTDEQKAELKAWHQSHHWHPHQLRHNAATVIRKELGLDVARAVLGHSSPVVTEHYAEIDATKAAEAMKQMG